MTLTRKQAGRLLRSVSRGLATSSPNGHTNSSAVTESSPSITSASSANSLQHSERPLSPSDSDDSIDRAIPESFWKSKVPMKLYPRSAHPPNSVNPPIPPSTVSTPSVVSTSSRHAKCVWTYKGVTRPYHLPSPEDRGPYYVVIKGKHFGVHRGW
jgi:hypothetical protein